MAADHTAAATRQQRLAANPEHSVILGASAGSGKTKVLVDRFIRLCIEEKTIPCHPRAILAITFTKKASIEIQERLLTQAAAMAMMSEEELRSELQSLFLYRENNDPTQQEMISAAGFYEKILEDVTALNVSTIHSFCQQILTRFAPEAGLDPHFTVLENTDELKDEALDLLELETIKDARLERAASVVAKDPQSVRRAMEEVFQEQMRIDRWLDRFRNGIAPDQEFDWASERSVHLPDLSLEIRTFLFPKEIIGSDTSAEPTSANFSGIMTEALQLFQKTAKNNIIKGLGADWESRLEASIDKITDKLGLLLPLVEKGESINMVGDVFLTRAGKVRVFAGIRNDVELKDRFNELMLQEALPILQCFQVFMYLEIYNINVATLVLGLRLLDIYEGLKRRDRVVDFHDLEEITRRLMSSPGQVENLLYRLDDSLRHILIDEFQDTNFSQWDIVRPFVEEFLAGSDGPAKTVFFVGDVKQSIYGFRGAEPALFPMVEKKLKEYGHLSLNLPTNFRSLEAVVDGVGYLFTKASPAKGLPPEELANVWQKWIRNDARGEVRIIREFANLDPDGEDGRSGDQLAAAAAAGQVLHLLNDGAITWDWNGKESVSRPLQWNDILVLCRSRTSVSIYEKAFREAGIPIVPPGRGMLAASREVQDLLALLRWLVWPEDDVALASVLRSPIFRVSEKLLQELLSSRGLDRKNKKGKPISPRTLWQVVRSDSANSDLGFISSHLKNWRKHMGFENSHDLLRRIYSEGNIPLRYQVSMGDQARYNLMRLYDLALSPEIAGTPTVRKFIAHIERAALKGEEDEGVLPESSGGGRVRFMTIHGAKGLEAPVVILVDADRPSKGAGDRLRMNPNSTTTGVLFKVKAKMRQGLELPVGFKIPMTNLQAASFFADERALREETNLLYVALTRARDRVIVIGGEKLRHETSPLQQLAAAAQNNDCSVLDGEDPEWLERPPQEVLPSLNDTATEIRQTDIKLWQPPTLGARFKTITPSTTDGVLPQLETSVHSNDTGSRIDAMARGDQVHLLLQLAADRGSMPKGSGPIWEEAASVFHNPDLEWIFFPEKTGGRGLSEAPVIHRTAEAVSTSMETRTYGIIDRLIIKSDRIDIVDYKTNRTGCNPAERKKLSDHYRPQLAAYKIVIANLFPNRDVHTWLLFTEPAFMKGQPPLDSLWEVQCDG